jgi:hypothetical protein
LRWVICSVIALMTMTGLAHAISLRAPEAGLLWNNRIVLVFDGEGSRISQQQLTFMKTAAYGWRDRNLVLIAASATGSVKVWHQGQLSQSQEKWITGLSSADLIKTYGFSGIPGQSALIGKDGGVKRRASGAIKNNILFETIDVMPMRQREIGR